MFIWDAFWDLSAERRNHDNIVGSIPWTAINDYAQRYNITDITEFDSFVFVLRSLDSEFRNIQQKEINKKNSMPKKPKRTRTPRRG
jgi:hypothetical protein